MSENLSDGLYAVIDTDKGNITLNLEFEKTPMTVMNFVGLAEGVLNKEDEGTPFYDGLNFHRVIDNFMIQGGCPLGTGTGGPGYKFPDEFDSSLRHSAPGVLSMANAGPGTNGSQFFITHVETPWLDDKHTVFGKVVDGMNVVNSIAQGDKINSIKIERIGDAAKAFTVSRETFDDLVNNSQKLKLEKLKKERAGVLKAIKKAYPDAIETDSGLLYVVRKEGDKKESPKMGDSVTVHYEGKLLDGKVFDSSKARGVPATFQIGTVIEGWNEALQTMTVGEERTLIIPPELGYGEGGYPGVIPPNAYLIFNVELLKF
ncbi:MAG: peptidylprolyl isomerase [Sphaerochaetaceae bacterium]|nr:peptidylprolyl isomerase [Sphaerochaetaceae bacterium]MDC7243377.1 peptidylprolyl isomerase [Sphaerochaetaceae bacterium]MDC7249143.1 peptidylprolyl isomerase [Sphaerochaetaceae bacterium]